MNSLTLIQTKRPNSRKVNSSANKMPSSVVESTNYGHTISNKNIDLISVNLPEEKAIDRVKTADHYSYQTRMNKSPIPKQRLKPIGRLEPHVKIGQHRRPGSAFASYKPNCQKSSKLVNLSLVKSDNSYTNIIDTLLAEFLIPQDSDSRVRNTHRDDKVRSTSQLKPTTIRVIPDIVKKPT
jgi:hypothetical protein